MTIVATVGVMPYIALQLKAVSGSVGIMLAATPPVGRLPSGLATITTDTAFYVALLLAAFSILFGTRHLDATERHEGMVAAVAFESLVKLAAFLAVGIFVTYGMYDGFGDIFARAAAEPRLRRMLTLDSAAGGYERWFSLVSVSMLAFLCLPRQFQMGVVENVSESHVRKATWLFPLYMLLINIFVLPIALGGMMRFPSGDVDADNFVLTLPLVEGHQALAFLVFVGGPVRLHRHDHRGDAGAVDHDLQRPGDAGAAALQHLESPAARRPVGAGDRRPARGDRPCCFSSAMPTTARPASRTRCRRSGWCRSPPSRSSRRRC